MGHLRTLTFRKTAPSTSKSTSTSMNSTQHTGHIRASAFKISSCLASLLSLTAHRKSRRLRC
jgi:hypothetical protein